MSKDILYREEGFVFSCRVGGVLVHNGRMLFQREIGDDGYAVIGGHVTRGESCADTLVREFMEEIHAPVQVGDLLATAEIFFPWGKRACHQICLYFRVELTDAAAIPPEGSFRGYDDLGGERTDLEFCWVSPEELRDATVYPQELKPYLLSLPEAPVHLVSRELPREAYVEADV